MKIKLFLAAMVALLAMAFTTLQNRPWELLGTRSVNYKLDHDEILVTRVEGVFTAVQLRIKHSPINMHKMVIHYGNGETDEIDIRTAFRAGSKSGILDLPGNKRVIRKVVLWYDTKNLANNKGVVELWGKH